MELEIDKNGFSGYVTEVLILKVRFISCTYFRSIISCTRGKNDNLDGSTDEETAKKTFKHSVIILDRIDLKRNLKEAAISVENFGKFVLGARTFLNKPSIEFFIRQERVRTTNDFSEIYSNILVVSFNYREMEPRCDLGST